MHKPSAGRIVQYRLAQDDVNAINEQRGVSTAGLRGNPVAVSQVYPMMIVRVWTEDPKPTDAVQGQVFLDGNDTIWKTSVHLGDEPGTFFWPEIKKPVEQAAAVPSVRAKFKCTGKSPNGEEGDQIQLSAVTSGNKENEQFFRWTPFGELTMGTVNPAASAQFEVGKEYYLDFTPAE